ncbi:MAG: HlyD family secretion protein, partial [Bacillota bacterium]
MKLSKRGKIVVGILVFIIVIAIGINAYDTTVSKELYKVKKGEVTDKINSSGVVHSDTIKTLYSLVNSEIIDLKFEVGDKVKKGEIIAKFDKEQIEYQIEGIDAQIRDLNYKLKEACKPADKEKIENLEYKIDIAKIDYDSAKKDLIKMEKLYDNQAISKDSLENYREAEMKLKKELASLENNLKLLKKKISSNIKMQYYAQINSLRSQKKSLVKSKKECDLIAPVDGIITEEFVQEGKYVTKGVPIYEISNLSNIRILSDVLESEINSIKKNSEVLIEDEYKKRFVKGVVLKKHPKIYEKLTELGIKQRKVDVEIKPMDLSNNYLLNQKLDLEFIIERKKNVLRIPIDSYFEDNNKFYV